MKNAIKNIFGIIALAAAIAFGGVACDSGGGTKLSGTYVGEMGMTYTFSGKKVTVTFMGEKEEATYEIKDGKYYVTDPADGKVTEYTFTLEGDKLTLVNGREKLVLTKK
jgi:DNA-binding beta-propeller fold protein YncE